VDVVRHLNYEQVRASVALMPRLLEELEQHSPYSRDELARRLAEAANVRPEDFCDWARIQYIAPITSDYQQIPDYSCDVVYSTAVFEHIYRSDLASTLHQIRRILRPTGFTTHVIDLKDHFCYSQSGLPYNNFLRFSDSQWQRWTGNPLTYTNRMFVSDWEKLFADCGFRVVFLDEVIERRLPRLPSHLLHDQWRDCSERDLSVGEIHIVARPAA
jgi:SAM-dependent methyltransferase